MRILVLSKRQCGGKDLLDDRCGRLYEIPAALATRGHEVKGIALSYRRRLETSLHDDRLEWSSVNVFPTGIWNYPQQLAATVRRFKPNVIWAGSDAFHAIGGWFLSCMTGVPAVLDLYDNFESFAATRLPGIMPLFRTACRRAAGLTLVSRSLQDFIKSSYETRVTSRVVGNGVRTGLFFPRDRFIARRILNLPESARIIGTAGSLTANRGIDDLFEAFLRLAEQDSNLYLAVAGPRDSTISRYRHSKIVDLGVLSQEQVPYLLSSLDVGVICNRDSNFGRNCFPLKFYEIVASGLPVVAACVGDVGSILSKFPWCLYPPGNVEELAQRIYDQLHKPYSLQIPVPKWEDLSMLVETFLLEVQRSFGLSVRCSG